MTKLSQYDLNSMITPDRVGCNITSELPFDGFFVMFSSLELKFTLHIGPDLWRQTCADPNAFLKKFTNLEFQFYVLNILTDFFNFGRDKLPFRTFFKECIKNFLIVLSYFLSFECVHYARITFKSIGHCSGVLLGVIQELCWQKEVGR